MKPNSQLAFKSRTTVHYVTGWYLNGAVIPKLPRPACPGADRAWRQGAAGESADARQGLALSSFSSALLVNLSVVWPESSKVLQKVFEGFFLIVNHHLSPYSNGKICPFSLKHLTQNLSELLFHCVMHLLPHKIHLFTSSNYNIKK